MGRDGLGRERLPGDRLRVNGGPDRSPTLQGDQVVSGPEGVTGYITATPDGSFKVVVRDLSASIGEKIFSTSKRSTSPACR